jgi:hypothetical protein
VTERLALAVAIRGLASGMLDLQVKAIEPSLAFQLAATTIIVSIWSESEGLVRARLEHVDGGATSYLQGNSSLMEFGRELGLLAVRASGAE